MSHFLLRETSTELRSYIDEVSTTSAFGSTSAAGRNEAVPPPAQKKKGGPAGRAACKLTENNGVVFPLNPKHQGLG